MNKKKLTIEIIILVVFVGNLLLLYYIFQDISDDSYQCIQDPLVFGAKVMKKLNNAEFSCTCSLAQPNSPLIHFNSQDLNVEFPNQQKSDAELYSSIEGLNLNFTNGH